MPKLKTLSGREVIVFFESVGFYVEKQKGSHIKLKRITEDDIKQILLVPNHSDLDKGTIKAICNQASKYISEKYLREFFYNK